jgi:hypothetical protein
MDFSKDKFHSDDTSSLSSFEREPQLADILGHSSYQTPIQRLSSNKTGRSIRSHIDQSDLVNLPFRTLSNNAAVEEYTEETIDGQILKEVASNRTGKIERYQLVTWKINDPENPKNWSKLYKWWCTMIVALTCFCVAFNSAVITADIKGPAREFGISNEVALLSVTVFVIGFGVGKYHSDLELKYL